MPGEISLRRNRRPFRKRSRYDCEARGAAESFCAGGLAPSRMVRIASRWRCPPAHLPAESAFDLDSISHFMRSDHGSSLFVLRDDAGDAPFVEWKFFRRALLQLARISHSGGALALSALFLAELIAGQRLLAIRGRIHVTPRVLAVGLAMILSLWSLQVYLAVSRHKSELLNPSGLLYAFFVK